MNSSLHSHKDVGFCLLLIHRPVPLSTGLLCRDSCFRFFPTWSSANSPVVAKSHKEYLLHTIARAAALTSTTITGADVKEANSQTPAFLANSRLQVASPTRVEK